MENENDEWIKFNDTAETAVKKSNISFIAKREYIECEVSLNKDTNIKMFQILVYFLNSNSIQLYLNYKNKKKRDKDYNFILNNISKKDNKND